MKTKENKKCIYCGADLGTKTSRMCSRCGEKVKLIRTIKAMLLGCSYEEVRRQSNKALHKKLIVKRFANEVLNKAKGQTNYYGIKKVINEVLKEKGIDTNE